MKKEIIDGAKEFFGGIFLYLAGLSFAFVVSIVLYCFVDAVR